VNFVNVLRYCWLPAGVPPVALLRLPFACLRVSRYALCLVPFAFVAVALRYGAVALFVAFGVCRAVPSLYY
jgi:hypothetical protein